MSDTVAARVTALPGKQMAELKEMWRDLYGSEPPRHNKTHLVKRLAYRIQELAYGGPSAQTIKRLDALADEEEARVTGKKPRRRLSDQLIAGTRLVREWDGVEHTVTVLTDGFDFEGRRYKSLSAIARAITGTRWNGPLFFGLRKTGVS